MSTLSIRKLFKYGVSKRVPNKKFLSLYELLEQKTPIKNNDYITDFLELNDCDSISSIDYHINLVLYISFSSMEQLKKFWNNLTESSLKCQLLYLIRLNKMIVKDHSSISKDVIEEMINDHLNKYTNGIFFDVKQLSDLSEIHLSIVNHLVFLWGSLIDTLHNYLDIHAFKKLGTIIVGTLKKLGLNNMVNFLISKTKKIFNTDELDTTLSVPGKISKSTQNTSSFKNISIINLDQKKYNQIIISRKFIWVYQKIKLLTFDNKSFLDTFVKLFFDKNKSQPHAIASSLITSVLKGYSFSIESKDSSYILCNWKNFLLSRLGKILSELRFTEKETFENAIRTSLDSLDENTTNIISNYELERLMFVDLRKLFIKSCIHNELIPVQSYFNFFPNDSTNQQSLIHELNQFKSVVDLNQSFRDKLVNVNCEFTSLEESGFVEFINSLPKLISFSSDMQSKLSATVNATFDELISEKQTEKISRLILSILNNFDVLNYVCLNLEDGPSSIICKLMRLIDSEEFDVDDDDNFQDLYSYFGVILLGIITIAEVFEIDYSKYSTKNSYSLDYLNNFYYRLCDNLTNSKPKNISDDENLIIDNFNNLVNDWIDALFDDTNEGLSDELIKSGNVKQIYKMVSIIYQQAIIATNNGKIDLKILKNGIDYLSQPFLAPCNLSLISWLLRKMQLSDNGADSLPVKVLYEILISNIGNSDDQELNNESILMFKIILNVKGNFIISILKEVPNWSESQLVVEMIDKISKKLDQNSIKVKDRSGDIDNNLHLNEQIKSFILELFSGNCKNYNMIIALIELNKPGFVNFILDEIISYQKSSNENTKIFISLAISIIASNYVESSEDRDFWINQLSDFSFTPAVEFNIPKASEFTLSMESHFSSIFSDISSQKDIDDDDLFNDAIDTQKNTSFHNLYMKGRRFDNILHELVLVGQYSDTEKSQNNKAIKTLSEGIIQELKRMFV